jgi:hypothetical protein
MKFESWKKLYEDAANKNIEGIVDKLASQLEDEIGKKFYVIPEIDTFSREEEPIQIGYLLTDDDARSMRLNFTEEGQLYSVDYWKPDSDEPSITVYLNDLSIERALGKLIALYKNPSSKTITEDDQSSELIITKPEKTKEADPIILKAKKEGEYELQNPAEIFDDLETYVDMVVNGDMYALLLTGQAGVGKSFLVTKRLNEKGLKRNQDYFVFKGKMTGAGLYITLYQNNGKMLIIDDCDSIFKDENGVNTLKGALDTSKEREITWTSAAPIKGPDKEPIPKRFDYTGKVIFITNLPKKKIDAAIRSRAFVLEIALSQDDMIKRMWRLIDEIELPSGVKVIGAIRGKAMKMIVKAAVENDKIDLNLRTLLKAIAIVNKVKDDTVSLRLIKQQCKGV